MTTLIAIALFTLITGLLYVSREVFGPSPRYAEFREVNTPGPAAFVRKPQPPVIVDAVFREIERNEWAKVADGLTPRPSRAA